MDDKKLSRRALLSFGGMSALFLCLSPGVFATPARAQTAPTASRIPSLAHEDGYRAWLRYEQISDPTVLDSYVAQISSTVGLAEEGNSSTAHVARFELTTALSSLLGRKIPVMVAPIEGSVILGTDRSPLIAKLLENATLKSSADAFTSLRNDGYLIHTINFDGKKLLLIAAKTDNGALYGAFAFLRLLVTRQAIGELRICENPKNPLRVLVHLDNLDGTIERGYAGHSLWNWNDLPGQVDARLIDYARLNASIGINAVVINNVNAAAAMLNATNLDKAAALAKQFRPYGIRLFLCANFAAPKELGHLPTADPLDGQVRQWWANKASEIYAKIPDFGGFLVKANSEDLPGPQDYGRTHADGANMLAAALVPHGGIVIWRAFVYTVGNQNQDRVKRAYLDFKPLDGKFAHNALVQIKNGPLDYQPREPFHPLFGALKETRMVGELEVTQEYLGQSTHLVFLASLWKEVLDSNTYSPGTNFSVAQAIQNLPQSESGGMSGIANTGSDRSWCGHHFAQANWFAYGRLAWNSDLTAAAIADEWIKMTWSNEPDTVAEIRKIMLESHQAYVDYTMPLGLHHMVGGDHYAPLPEGEGDPRGIYHHAAADGIGYDRTRAGSDAVDEYNPPLNDLFNNPATCPEKYLLWFHHLPWTFRMKSGRTVWDELCFKYKSGAQTAHEMERQWLRLKDKVDERRHLEVAGKLHKQAQDADDWARKCLTYFALYSKMPIS